MATPGASTEAAAAFITSVDVSYGPAMVPAHNRLVNKAGVSVNVNAANSAGTPVFLWIKTSEDDPLADVSILYDDEPVPEGYRKIARDLGAASAPDGTGARSYLAVKPASSTDTHAITMLAVLAEGDAPDADFKVLDRSLNRSGPAIRLALRMASTAASDAALLAWSAALKLGDWVDAQDKSKRWRVARIVAVAEDGASVRVSYKGWNSKHDEDLPRASRRLAKPGVHTAGKDTRVARVQGALMEVNAGFLESLTLRIDDLMSGDFPPDEVDQFAKAELPQTLETILSSKFEGDEIQDAINVFNQKVIQLVVHELRKVDDPIPPEVRQFIARLFLDDKTCDFFYEKHGFVKPNHPLAAMSIGWAARLPAGGASRFYVANLNLFYSLGGYDVLIERFTRASARARAAMTAVAPPASSVSVPPPASAAVTASASTPAAAEVDVLDEMLHLSNIIFTPRYVYTVDWYKKYYQPITAAVMDRVLTAPEAQLRRADRDSIDGIRLNMLKLGEQGCAHYKEEEAAIIAGPEGALAGDTSVNCFFERWGMDLALRLIRMDALPLRVKGITEVRDMVEAVNTAAAGGSGSTGGGSAAAGHRRVGVLRFYMAPAPVAHWYDTPKLLAWLTQHRVVDILLGERVDAAAPCPVHNSTLARLTPIMEFMARAALQARARARDAAAPAADAPAAPADDTGAAAATGVTSRQIELLFGLLKQDDDALRRVVFDTVNTVCTYLPADMLDVVYTALLRIPLCHYDDATVALMKKFTETALRTSLSERTKARWARNLADAPEDADPRDVAANTAAEMQALPLDDANVRDWYGLKQLWDAAVGAGEPAPAGDVIAAKISRESVSKAAREALADIVRASSREAYHMYFVERCVSTLRTPESADVVLLIKLFNTLLLALPEGHGQSDDEATAGNVLRTLEANEGLSHLLLDEMRGAAAAAGGSVDGLTTRLDFLRYVVQQSAAGVSADDVATVWRLYAPSLSATATPTTAGESISEAFFSWLVQLSQAAALSEDTMAAVLRDLFCNATTFHVETAGPKAYAAFAGFMLRANAALGALTVLGTDADAFVVRNVDMVGMDRLWDLALHNSNKDVSRDAMRALVSCHTQLRFEREDVGQDAAVASTDASLRRACAQKKETIWASFVARCMHVIDDARVTAAGAAGAPGSAPSPAQRTAAKLITKALRLLSSFLEAVEAASPSRAADKDVILVDGKPRMPAEGPDLDGVAVRPMSAFIRHYDASTKRAQLETITMEVRPAVETVGAVRDRLGEGFGIPGSRVLLNEMSDKTRIIGTNVDSMTLEQSRHFYGVSGETLEEPTEDLQQHAPLSRSQRILQQLRLWAQLRGMTPAEVAATVQEAQEVEALETGVCDAPRRLLSSRAEFFDSLFSLLSVPYAGIVADAWNLLQSLPTSPKVEADICTLCGRLGSGASHATDAPMDWDSILDLTSPLKLLYSLQIVVRQLDTLDGAAAAAADAPSTPATAADSLTPAALGSAWVRAFVAAGGLAHLYKLVCAVDLRALLPTGGSHLMKECARLLLLLFTRFTMSSTTLALRVFPSETTPAFSLERDVLARRLLTWLSFATTTSLAREGDASSIHGGLPDRPPTLLERTSSTDGGARRPTGGAASAAAPKANNEPLSESAAWAALTSLASGDAGEGEGVSLRNFFADGEDEWEPVGAAADPKADANAVDEGAAAPEAEIVTHTLRLLTACAIGGEEAVAADGSSKTSPHALHAQVLRAVYDYSHVARVFLTALCAPADAGVRTAVVNALASLCELAAPHTVAGGAADAPATFLIHMLVGGIPGVYEYPTGAASYFKLLQTLLTMPVPSGATGTTAAAAAGLDVRAAISSVTLLLRAHPIVELGSDEKDVQDVLLRGLLNTLRCLLEGQSDEVKHFAGQASGCDLIEEVFERCLFAVPVGGAQPLTAGAAAANGTIASVLGGELPKCKAALTRKAAFDVLTELAAGCPRNGARLCEKLLPHHDAEAAAAEGAERAALVRSNSNPGGTGATAADDDDDFGLRGRGAATSGGRGKYGSISSSDVQGGGAGAAVAEADATGTSAAAATIANRSKQLMAARSSTGYVGLRNLGCICYMNATMQQFFMNADFRRGVLAWAEPAASAEERAESLMFQLQREFAYLQESAKQYYNPKGLCHSIKDWEGNPTDIAEQKDVPEFLTKLFSDMETQCQGSKLATLPKDVFGGVSIQELIADDPRGEGRKRLYATRDEDYYFLQVTIKNQRTLQEALANYVTGETVDYKWTLPADAAAPTKEGAASSAGGAAGGDAGDAKEDAAKSAEVKTTRRVSLKSIGDHLMVHLSRFEFDYETMQQQKLNDRFEFPRVIDMWPYTVYGRADSVATVAGEDGGAAHRDRDRTNYVYELVGVVIHMGSAIGGHYYSYIRERGEAGPGERWFEFNDAYVSPWEATDKAFDADCFGGVETYSTGGYSHTTYVNGVPRVYNSPAYSHERVKSANAFCLFYDRKRTPVEAPMLSLPAAAAPAPPGGDAAVPVPGAAAAVALRAQSAATAPALAHAASSPLEAFIAALRKSHSAASASAGIRAPVPSAILTTIQAENLEFWRLRTIYESDYSVFIQDLIRNVVPPEKLLSSGSSYPWDGSISSTADAMARGGLSFAAVRLAIAFMLNTLVETGYRSSSTGQWLSVARTLLVNNTVACYWLVQSYLRNREEYTRVMLAPGTPDASRTVLALLLSLALSHLWSVERAGPPPGVTPAAGGYPTPPGRVTQTFIDTLLLGALPRVHVHWLRFGPFFSQFVALSTSNADMRTLLINRGTIGKLVDFMLCGDGPHPEVNADPTAAPGTVRSMGEGRFPPDLDAVLHAILQLAVSCVPPSGVAGSPHASEPHLPLSDVDADMLTCVPFWRSLSTLMQRNETVRTLTPLVAHILWGVALPPPPPPVLEQHTTSQSSVTSDVSTTTVLSEYGVAQLLPNLANLLDNAIRVYDFDHLRQVFLFAGAICDVAGDSEGDVLQAQRVGVVMVTLSEAMRTQSRFYRATELGIEHWTKLAKRRPVVRAWLSANQAAWAWMEDWLQANELPPSVPHGSGHGRLDDTGMRMYKGGGYYYSQYNSMNMRAENTLENVQWLQTGQEPEFETYESDDDPESVVGRACIVSFHTQRSFDGRIVAYDAGKGEHLVKYGVSTERLFNLADRKFASIRLAMPRYSALLQARRDAVLAAQAAAAPAPAADSHGKPSKAGSTHTRSTNPFAQEEDVRAGVHTTVEDVEDDAAEDVDSDDSGDGIVRATRRPGAPTVAQQGANSDSDVDSTEALV